jgi:membrane carboxypeptidase/penicillin-binding protein PbpC
MTALDTAGEIGGRIAGGALGGVLGGMVGGPVGAWIGRAVGSKLGAIAGKAAAAALANAMEEADEDAKPIPDTKAEPCKDCGEIKCFEKPEGADPEEFKRQLKEQQDGINRMKPDDLLNNMDKFAQNGRPSGDAKARRDVRNDWLQRRRAELEGKNFSPSEAGRMALDEMKTLDALHAPDLAAGGDGTFADRGLGPRSSNRSIGPQWDKERLGQLKEHGEKAKKQGKKNNVELKMCPEKSGGEKGSSSPAPKGNGNGSTNPNVPVS